MCKLLLCLFVLVCCGASSMLLLGCDSSSTQNVNQSVEDMVWLPDGSGLIAYIQNTSVSEVDGSTSVAANIYRVSSGGSIGNAIDASDQGVTSDYPPLVFVSPDGKSVVTPFGPSIFRVDLSSGNATNIIQNTNLYGVSAGLHYVLTSDLPSTDPTKLLKLFDLTSNPIRLLLPSQTRVGISGNRALWIDSTRFALTVNDTIGPNGLYLVHVTIYDTSGNQVMVIPDASVGLHGSAYAPISGDLFFTTNELGIDKVNLAAGLSSRKQIISNDTVESLDVSADGTLLVYSSGAVNNNRAYNGYAVNVSNGNIKMIASSMVAPFISPNAQSVAFIHNTGDANGDEDINEVPVSLP